MIERDNRQDLSELRTPQKITSQKEGDFLVFKKGDRLIVKFNAKDSEGKTENNERLFDAVRLLGGILAADCIKGEIEELRDLILMEVGS